MYQTCPLCKGKGTFKKSSCPVCLGERIIAKNTGLPPSKYVVPYRENGVMYPGILPFDFYKVTSTAEQGVFKNSITTAKPQFVTYTN
jgi:hypothetical protein